jgi:hypothetical protein
MKATLKRIETRIKNDNQFYNVGNIMIKQKARIDADDTPATEEELAKAGIGLDSRRQDESLLEYIKRTCVWCQRSKGDDRSVLEFLIRSPGIWLHALQYQMEGPDGTICYRTKFPKWSLGIGNA